jgi:hypothetical protein
MFYMNVEKKSIFDNVVEVFYIKVERVKTDCQSTTVNNGFGTLKQNLQVLVHIMTILQFQLKDGVFKYFKKLESTDENNSSSPQS